MMSLDLAFLFANPLVAANGDVNGNGHLMSLLETELEYKEIVSAFGPMNKSKTYISVATVESVKALVSHSIIY